MKRILTIIICLGCIQCHPQNPAKEKKTKVQENENSLSNKYRSISYSDSSFKTIHVFVALCDNVNQGIVPVPPIIGNGQDPDNNLYWGAGYGIRTFFKKSKDWQLVSASKPDTIRLQRLVFKHKTNNYYLVADAYDGRYIRNCIEDFMASASGQLKDTISSNTNTIGIDGNASLVAYIGHDGLMNFELSDSFNNADGKTRDCIILACSSRQFFGPYLKKSGIRPLVLTASLMCPEAYTLHDALEGYLKNENADKVRARAVKAYAKYQNNYEYESGEILVTGWE